MSIHPGLLLMQAQITRPRVCLSATSRPVAEMGEFILNQTMKRPCFFAEHCSGGGKTAAILAEFSYEKHLPEPLWFA